MGKLLQPVRYSIIILLVIISGRTIALSQTVRLKNSADPSVETSDSNLRLMNYRGNAETSDEAWDTRDILLQSTIGNIRFKSIEGAGGSGY